MDCAFGGADPSSADWACTAIVPANTIATTTTEVIDGFIFSTLFPAPFQRRIQFGGYKGLGSFIPVACPQVRATMHWRWLQPRPCFAICPDVSGLVHAGLGHARMCPFLCRRIFRRSTEARLARISKNPSVRSVAITNLRIGPAHESVVAT